MVTSFQVDIDMNEFVKKKLELFVDVSLVALFQFRATVIQL